MLCAVYGCNSGSSDNSEISFHIFPKDEKLCKKWVLLCRRKDKLNTKTARICSKHFAPGDFICPNPVYGQYGIKVKSQIKRNVAPTLLLPMHKQAHLLTTPRSSRIIARSTRLSTVANQTDSSTEMNVATTNNSESEEIESEIDSNAWSSTQTESPLLNDCGTSSDSIVNTEAYIDPTSASYEQSPSNEKTTPSYLFKQTDGQLNKNQFNFANNCESMKEIDDISKIAPTIYMPEFVAISPMKLEHASIKMEIVDDIELGTYEIVDKLGLSDTTNITPELDNIKKEIEQEHDNFIEFDPFPNMVQTDTNSKNVSSLYRMGVDGENETVPMDEISINNTTLKNPSENPSKLNTMDYPNGFSVIFDKNGFVLMENNLILLQNVTTGEIVKAQYEKVDNHIKITNQQADQVIQPKQYKPQSNETSSVIQQDSEFINSRVPLRWTDRQTRYLFSAYGKHVTEVGPYKKFRNKRELWQFLAEKLNSMYGQTFTATQVQTRVKTVRKRKKKKTFDAPFDETSFDKQTTVTDGLNSDRLPIIRIANESLFKSVQLQEHIESISSPVIAATSSVPSISRVETPLLSENTVQTKHQNSTNTITPTKKESIVIESDSDDVSHHESETQFQEVKKRLRKTAQERFISQFLSLVEERNSTLSQYLKDKEIRRNQEKEKKQMEKENRRKEREKRRTEKLRIEQEKERQKQARHLERLALIDELIRIRNKSN